MANINEQFQPRDQLHILRDQVGVYMDFDGGESNETLALKNTIGEIIVKYKIPHEIAENILLETPQTDC